MRATQRDIFLVPFPFSDFSGKKIRPVLIVSNDRFNKTNEDVVICGITSHLDKHSYTVFVSPEDLEEGLLHAISAIKVESLLKIDASLLIKKIGKLKKERFNEVQKCLRELFKA